MTKKSTSWINKPFLLKPAAKDYLWGGNRLIDDYAKEIDITPVAETWECSIHPDGVSIINSGEYKGKLLSEVLKLHPEYLGRNTLEKGFFPILVKIIDAKHNLSIQVHPDDKYAKEHENGSLGKTEMWYVLDAEPGAYLIHGFYKDVTREMIQNSIKNNTIENYLQKIPIKKGDVFFIEAGTVHAICAGALIVEVQENSNLTYRIYDYNRRDSHGNKRELHIKKAMDVMNFSSTNAPRQPLRVLKYSPGCASELLCRCQYFQVERQLINTEHYRKMVTVNTNRDSFQVLLCTEGCGSIQCEQMETLCFFSGDCIFIPAKSAELKLHGKAQLLKISC